MKRFLSVCVLSTLLFDAGLLVVSFATLNVSVLPQVKRRLGQSKVVLSLFQDDFKKLFFANQQDIREKSIIADNSSSGTGAGVIVRVAAREYDPVSSKPSSRQYTPRKAEFPSVQITKAGVNGDYNHYRTVALKSTKNRAVSILTQDVMNSLRSTYKSYNVQDGDLGENILVAGVSFDFFRIGECYQFSCPDSEDAADTEKAVIVEITEPMEPCANLCKLSYINDSSIKPSDRIERCQGLIGFLNRFDGYRGWYAKVHRGGVVETGAAVSHFDDFDS